MEGYVSRFGENGRVGGGWINSPEGTGSKYKVREVARGGKWSENDRKSGCAERKDVHFHYIGSANGGLCEKLGFTDFGGSVGTETAFSSWRHDPLCGLHTVPVWTSHTDWCGRGRGGAGWEVRGKSGGTGSYSPPTHTHPRSLTRAAGGRAPSGLPSPTWALWSWGSPGCPWA